MPASAEIPEMVAEFERSAGVFVSKVHAAICVADWAEAAKATVDRRSNDLERFITRLRFSRDHAINFW